jgi:hypothetical protein
MTTLLLIMFGGTIGFFTAALCKVAGSADRDIELLQQQEDRIADVILPETQKVPDLVQESVNFEKETLI